MTKSYITVNIDPAELKQQIASSEIDDLLKPMAKPEKLSKPEFMGEPRVISDFMANSCHHAYDLPKDPLEAIAAIEWVMSEYDDVKLVIYGIDDRIIHDIRGEVRYK